MKINHIVGIDVSKLTLDCYHHGASQKGETVSNDNKGFKHLLQWLKKKVSKKRLDEVLVVIEYTGYYTYQLEQFMYKHTINYSKKPALDIKRSCGMIRGKSDKADAKMISYYGWLRKEELKSSTPISDVQLELQQLMAYRDKLVADRKSYYTRTKELGIQLKDKLSLWVKQSSEAIIKQMSDEIKQTEQKIKTFLKQDELVHTNYKLLRSVRGIGFATAVHLLIATENFTRFNNHRKFACYCGVVPFENNSGTSIRGKTRVSHLANKKLKSLLTMAALSAIQHDVDLKAKYKQKLKEGKPKMCALNIIRAKLIERVFAVINRQSPYILRLAA